MTRPLTEILNSRDIPDGGTGCGSRLIACRGKEGFETFEQASAIAARIRKRCGGTSNPYRCWHCHKWHVGRRSP